MNGTTHENWFTRDQALVVFIDIGCDSIMSRKFMLMVEVYPTDEGTEFAFAIVEQYYQSLQKRPMFDSSETNSLIPKSFRPAIKRLLLSTTERLITRANHPNFYMTTYCSNLPEVALEKYDRLCEVFSRCGYECVRTEPVQGSYHWQMNRVT
jgi:hypothetical protein